MGRRQTGLMLLLAACVAGAAAAADSSARLADERCGAHGKFNETSGVCDCDNPWPEIGQAGWTGHNCTIAVYGAAVDGQDMTAGCASGGCNSLQPDGWVCFYSKLSWRLPEMPGQAWNFFTAHLNRTSADRLGDPDLFGLWQGGSRGIVNPHFTTSLKGADFRETSSGLHPSVTVRVARSGYGDGHDYEGAYLCVHAYSKGSPCTFMLEAHPSRCPGDYDAAGKPLMCQTPLDSPEGQRRYSKCTDAGTCVCSGPYAKPTPSVFDGLGFEDCSATVTAVDREELAHNSTFVAEHQVVDPDKWQFVKFHVAEEDYQVVVTLVEEGAGGYVDLYLKAGQPPGTANRAQYDYRPAWNAVAGNRQLSIGFDVTSTRFRTGAWYAGVLGDHAPSNYTLTIAAFPCPTNCSGHGTCALGATVAENRCSCAEGYGGDDCSRSSRPLEWSVPAALGLHQFDVDYFTINATQGGEGISIGCSYYSEGTQHFMDVHPACLVGLDDFPTVSNYSQKLVLDRGMNVTHELRLCPSQLVPGQPIQAHATAAAAADNRGLQRAGGPAAAAPTGAPLLCAPAQIGVWNPGRIGTGGMAFNVTVSKVNASCVAGSRRGVRQLEQGGVCWQECVCDESGVCSFKDGECVDFTCDSPSARRKGNESACVQDECTRDEMVVTQSEVCLRNCTCPASGDACKLSADCGVRVAIAGGGKKGMHGASLFFYSLVLLGLGAVGAAAYIHVYGIPPWLPIRSPTFRPGMYQELSEGA